MKSFYNKLFESAEEKTLRNEREEQELLTRNHVQSLLSGDLFRRREATGALWNLARNEENQILMARVGAIEPLVGSLGDEDTVVKRNATGALWNLSVNVVNKVLMAGAGAIEPLVRLLGDWDSTVIQNAAGALANLGLNNRNKDALREAHAIEALIRLLGDRNSEITKQAARALWNLSDNHIKNQEVIINNDGISVLKRLVTEGNAEVKRNAQGVLDCCQAQIALRVASAKEVSRGQELGRKNEERQVPLAAECAGANHSTVFPPPVMTSVSTTGGASSVSDDGSVIFRVVIK